MEKYDDTAVDLAANRKSVRYDTALQWTHSACAFERLPGMWRVTLAWASRRRGVYACGGANGQQRIIEARRVWTDAAVMLALQEAAGTYGVPITVERVVAPQPVQVIGQVRPGRRTFKRREIGERMGIDKVKVPRADTSPEPLDPKTDTREK